MDNGSDEQKRDWTEELHHFEECRKLISKNTDQYEKEYHNRHREALALNKAMKEDPELYERFATMKSLEEQSANQVRKSKTAYEKPYFGRIDYSDLERDKDEIIYIGKNGVFSDKTEVAVADWRAPISSVYYENELGKGTYQIHVPDEKQIPVNLSLKRTYHIEDSALKGFYDSDVASNDELLVQYLSKNKDVVLGEIIATIQKEQNEIIRESPFSNQIVQGVAGSGKTTVAMHRISYILYNYKERFTSNEFCIVGSNDLLLGYITSGLPELDVPNIKQMRMDCLLTHLLHKEWKKKNVLIEEFPDAQYRSDINCMKRLDAFLQSIKQEWIPVESLKDRQLGLLSKESGNKALIKEQDSYSVVRLLRLMDERVILLLDTMKDTVDSDIIKKKKKEYRNYFKNKIPKETIFTIYHKFLTMDDMLCKVITPEHDSKMQKGSYDVYDVAALLLIYYRIFQQKEDEEFGQIFADESQDFGSGIYYVLKTVLPGCYFTIMGDVSQNIHYETGINDWEELREWFLRGEKDRFKILAKSYRNTIEISEYAGRILEKASAGKYKINPVIRHGAPVEEKEFWSEEEMADYAKTTMEKGKEKGFGTCAVICRNEIDEERVKKLLSEKMIITDGENNGLSKGIMVLPIHMTKGLEFDMVLLWNPVKLNDNLHSMEAKMLYVAATRALHELHVLYQ